MPLVPIFIAIIGILGILMVIVGLLAIADARTTSEEVPGSIWACTGIVVIIQAVLLAVIWKAIDDWRKSRRRPRSRQSTTSGWPVDENSC